MIGWAMLATILLCPVGLAAWAIDTWRRRPRRQPTPATLLEVNVQPVTTRRQLVRQRPRRGHHA